MSSAGPALLAAAAGVGFGHAVLPDHWVPLAVVGRLERYPLRRVARLATLAGAAHVAVSLILGAIVVAVGLQFRSAIEHTQDAIVGGILILTGVVFAGLELRGRGHHHGPGGHTHGPGGHTHDPGHSHTHAHPHGGRTALSVLVPFGAAASPDLTILPVFLAATTAGTLAAIGSLIVFATVTITTIVTLTVLTFATGHGLGARWLDRWGNAFTALVLFTVGALVATGVL